MRADRLLMELGLLQTEKKVTAESLANKLGVSVRTIYRDIEALCMAGIPVIAESGLSGGYSLPQGYKASMNGLMHMDIYPLVLRQLGTLWKDLELKSIDEASLKILGNASELHKRRLLQFRERILVDQTGWFTENAQSDSFLLIRMALMDNQQLEVVYEDASGKIREYIIEPYGLVYKAGVWYLVAYNNEKFKTYRVSRFLDVQTKGKNFERQQNFQLHEYWENSVIQYESLGEPIEVKLSVSPEFIREIPLYLGEEARKTVRLALQDEKSKWYSINWTFESINTMTSKILSMGPYVRITEPVSAVNLIYNIIEKTARLYQKDESNQVVDDTCCLK